MSNHEYGCVGHCLNQCLRFFGRRDFLAEIPDESRIEDLLLELRNRGLRFNMSLPAGSKLAEGYERHTIKRAAAASLWNRINGRTAAFMIGSAYDIYRLNEPWVHTIIALKDSHKINQYDPYEDLVAKSGKKFLKSRSVEEMILDPWLVIILTWPEAII